MCTPREFSRGTQASRSSLIAVKHATVLHAVTAIRRCVGARTGFDTTSEKNLVYRDDDGVEELGLSLRAQAFVPAPERTRGDSSTRPDRAADRLGEQSITRWGRQHAPGALVAGRMLRARVLVPPHACFTSEEEMRIACIART